MSNINWSIWEKVISVDTGQCESLNNMGVSGAKYTPLGDALVDGELIRVGASELITGANLTGDFRILFDRLQLSGSSPYCS